MTDSTPLSPAADAVLDAYMNNCGWLDGPLERDYRCAAAVLRAAADQVVPMALCVYNDDFAYVRRQMHAIADELDVQSQ